MGALILVGFLIALFFFPTLRCAVCHPFALAFYAVRDGYKHFREKRYNFCGSGELVAYTGLFGRGKTLSAVHKVVGMYKRFDGKKVWCPRRKKIVTQKIQVISNVDLKIPYTKLESLKQIVQAARGQQIIDDENDTLTVTLVLGDEFSVQMNSRNFRTNIDPLFLNTILTCRHYYISLYYTAQRFNHVDALLRQVTSYVVDCDKLWRFQRLNCYDAWEMENAVNPRMLTPYARSCWFVKDSDFAAYDTLAVVDNLEHAVEEKDMMTPEQILDLQRAQPANMEAVSKPSRRWLRRARKSEKK